MSGARLEKDIRRMSRAEARGLRAEVMALRDRVREMRRQHSGAVATERAARLARRREINDAIQALKKRARGDVVHYQTEAGLLRLEFSNWWRAVLEERARRREELRIALIALKEQRRRVPSQLRESIRTARAEAKATAARLRAERALVREGIRKDRHDLRVARGLHKQAAARARTPAQRGASRRAVEHWHEKLDSMAANLPPELARAWPMARASVMAAARKRKTITGDGLAELVGEWAEGHGAELAGREQSEADRDVARMVAEHEAAETPVREELSEPVRSSDRANPTDDPGLFQMQRDALVAWERRAAEHFDAAREAIRRDNWSKAKGELGLASDDHLSRERLMGNYSGRLPESYRELRDEIKQAERYWRKKHPRFQKYYRGPLPPF